MPALASHRPCITSTAFPFSLLPPTSASAVARDSVRFSHPASANARWWLCLSFIAVRLWEQSATVVLPWLLLCGKQFRMAIKHCTVESEVTRLQVAPLSYQPPSSCTVRVCGARSIAQRGQFVHPLDSLQPSKSRDQR